MTPRDSTQIVNGNNKISHIQVKYNRAVWQAESSVIHGKSSIVLNGTIHQQREQKEKQISCLTGVMHARSSTYQNIPAKRHQVTRKQLVLNAQDSRA